MRRRREANIWSVHTMQSSKRNKQKAQRELAVLAGTSHPQLVDKICQELRTAPIDAVVGRFADGECKIEVDQNIRGKDVYIIQSCIAPVNDSVMELLLLVSCAKRSGAKRVNAVIPYFGYKHHRRGSPISTGLSSRFLWSASADFAKMLEVVGVDRVISVDLQRPGQGHEACFFSSMVPVETIITVDQTAEYYANTHKYDGPVVVISPNPECIKKAQKFQKTLQALYAPKGGDVTLAAFVQGGYESGWLDPKLSNLFGDVQGKDVVIVDEMIDTGITLVTLSEKLKTAGAKTVTVTASHGLFTNNAMSIIHDSAAVDRVLVTDTLPLPENSSNKVETITVSKMLARVIQTEHTRGATPDEIYEIQ